MKKPLFNQNQRQLIINNTIGGEFHKLSLAALKARRELWMKYWIFGELIWRYEIKRKVITPMNSSIKRMWDKQEEMFNRDYKK